MPRSRKTRLADNPPRWLPSFAPDRHRMFGAERGAIVQEVLPRYEIEQLQLIPGLEPASLFPVPHEEYALEIGFGQGEHLAMQVQRNPQCGYIGCEIYTSGAASLLKSLGSEGASNLRIWRGDARLLLERLPPASLSAVYILYPDPWPKLRHNKRRIVEPKLLALLAAVIRPGGLLRLATDHADYAAWMLRHLLADPHFRWEAKTSVDWLQPPEDWTETKFEGQAKAAGRVPTYIDMRRV